MSQVAVAVVDDTHSKAYAKGNPPRPKATDTNDKHDARNTLELRALYRGQHVRKGQRILNGRSTCAQNSRRALNGRSTCAQRALNECALNVLSMGAECALNGRLTCAQQALNVRSTLSRWALNVRLTCS